MTYGEHQELVSAALLALMHLDHVPEGELDEVLQLRRQAHMAAYERLEELGLSRHERPTRGLDRTIASARHPLPVLASILDMLPAVEPGSEPPSELLARRDGDERTVAIASWRTVARHLTLGNHDLRASADLAWRNPKASWHLIGDLASTIDAFTLLEQETGTGQGGPMRGPGTALESRLAAGSVARVAGWRATDSSPDLAFAAPETTLGTLGGPRVHLVRQPEDFVLAQQALAGFLRPRLDDRDDIACLDRPGLLAARTVAAGQIRLAKAFASWAERDGNPELAERFLARVPLYADLHRSTLRLIEVRRTTSPLIVAQQSEAVQQLRRHHDARLDVATMHALDTATRAVGFNTGKSLRREALTRRNILAISDEGLEPVDAREFPSSQKRFATACQALVKVPQTSTAPPAASRPYRQQLAQSLNRPLQ